MSDAPHGTAVLLEHCARWLQRVLGGLRGRHRVVVSRLDVPRAEHAPVVLRPDADPGAIGTLVQRHLTPLTALGDLQPDHAPAQVCAIRGKPDQLTVAQARVDCDDHGLVQLVVP